MDLKLGVRMLARTPGLTIVAVIALSSAIGAGAAYLEVVNDNFRPSMSAAGGDRLVGVHVQDVTSGPHDRAPWRLHAGRAEPHHRGRPVGAGKRRSE